MKKITKNGITEIDNQEIYEIWKIDENRKFHYLVFDNRIKGFNLLDTFLRNYKEIFDNEQNIFDEIERKGEVCSLYPKLNMSIYPFKNENNEYSIDLKNIDKHFNDLLYLNDKVYKTNNLYIFYEHKASNMNKNLIIDKLTELINKSELLENIYLCNFDF